MLPDGTVVDNLASSSTTSDINTLYAAAVNVPAPDNSSASYYINPQNLSPMVEDGAPYSAIGSTELHMLRGSMKIALDPFPEQIKHFQFWKFVFVAHASTA